MHEKTYFISQKNTNNIIPQSNIVLVSIWGNLLRYITGSLWVWHFGAQHFHCASTLEFRSQKQHPEIKWTTSSQVCSVSWLLWRNLCYDLLNKHPHRDPFNVLRIDAVDKQNRFSTSHMSISLHQTIHIYIYIMYILYHMSSTFTSQQ